MKNTHILKETLEGQREQQGKFKMSVKKKKNPHNNAWRIYLRDFLAQSMQENGFNNFVLSLRLTNPKLLINSNFVNCPEVVIAIVKLSFYFACTSLYIHTRVGGSWLSL